MNTKVNKYPEETEADLFLKKHVGLIHCENKLTLMQRKICNILLFNALDKINEQDAYQISLRKLCNMIGYKSNDINLIKDALKGLISAVMEWNLLEDNKFLRPTEVLDDMLSWNASSLLAGVTIKGGQISYSYSPQIRQVLSSLEIYGRINLFVQSKFSSTYSLVLYENCVRFKNIQQTSWFELGLFRSLMGVLDNKYPSFKEFKRNVINIAVKEINQKSDIIIEPQYRRNGRTISAIQFLIADNENYKPTFRSIARKQLSVQPKDTSLVDILVREFEISSRQARQLIRDYKKEYLLEKIDLVRSKPSGVLKRPAYLIAAIKNDYQPKKVEVKPSSKPPAISYLREAKEASEIMFLKNKYMAYKLNAYVRALDAQEETFKQRVIESYEEELSANGELYRHYRRKGMTSPLIMADLIKFIDLNFPTMQAEVLTFDDFITTDVDETI